jgi:nucleotide-binding universal stress UspA family protein
MTTIRRILCPVDFSDHSRRALDHALAIAAWYDSTVTVLHVASVMPVAAYVSGSGMPAFAALTNEARDALRQSLCRFAGHDAGSAARREFEIAEGGTPETILSRASALPADLLVLGTHGRSGFERWVLGSVAERVLRLAPCPVLTVPKAAAEAAPILFRRIVCAIDFSNWSMSALDYATSLAQQSAAQLTVVYVIELPPDIPREVHETVLAGPRSLGEYIALAEEEGRARLNDAVADRVSAPATVDTVLAAGKPYREILRVAAEHCADLLVLGVHGRGALDRMFFGSTTQHLVRQARCPVLTLRTNSTI